MSIKHFEALNYKQILDFLKNPLAYQATEKVDGSQLFAGIDRDGNFYTTYNQRDLFYSAADYPSEFSSNYRKVAHLALEQSIDRLKRSAGIDFLIKVEVLFGKLPNVVEYDGKNRIVFLDCVRGTVNFDRLEQEFTGHTLSVTTDTLVCDQKLKVSEQTITCEVVFSRVPDWNFQAGVNFDQLYFYYKHFLDQITETGLNRAQVLDTNISHTSKYTCSREVMSRAKAIVQAENQSILAKIKDTLLDRVVRGRSGSLGSSWVEGVVFKSESHLFKLIDKEVFRSLQIFYWHQRLEVQTSSLDEVEHLFDKYINSYEQLSIYIDSLKKTFVYTEAVHQRTLEAYASILKSKNENRRSCINLTKQCVEIESVSKDIATS